MPAKSKILDTLNIPDKYFVDFLRGCIDGDGNIDVHSHPESQHLQLRLGLVSASPKFISWIKNEISRLLKIKGGWIENYAGVYIVSYGKADSIKLLKFMYYYKVRYFLDRKFQIAKQFMGE